MCKKRLQVGVLLSTFVKSPTLDVQFGLFSLPLLSYFFFIMSFCMIFK